MWQVVCTHCASAAHYLSLTRPGVNWFSPLIGFVSVTRCLGCFGVCDMQRRLSIKSLPKMIPPGFLATPRARHIRGPPLSTQQIEGRWKKVQSACLCGGEQADWTLLVKIRTDEPSDFFPVCPFSCLFFYVRLLIHFTRWHKTMLWTLALSINRLHVSIHHFCVCSFFGSGKIVSPKWKSFKGLRLLWRDKIRLNNAIWRAWFIQCEFAGLRLPPHHISIRRQNKGRSNRPC